MSSKKAVKKIKEHKHASSVTCYVKIELPGGNGSDAGCESIDKGCK